MTKFRPCIDLHEGCVKQIVGGTLRDRASGDDSAGADTGLIENYVSDQTPAWYAMKYRDDGLRGGHVIKLGPGNESAAREALAAFPGGLQIGGGITAKNAAEWIDRGASHVIVTSWLFDASGVLQQERLKELVRAVGRDRVVLDLSCRRIDDSPQWRVAMNRWQTLTEIEITKANLDRLAKYAGEFLIHAADVEGLCNGIDEDLVRVMGQWSGIPMTYAGGVATMKDVALLRDASQGRVDVTVGSALDLFGGSGVNYDELVQWSGSQE